MREIKFRFWDKVHSLMKNDYDGWADDVGINQMVKYLNDWKDLEVMQFTGLHDKNGKEIYEGDIVKAYDETLKDYVNQLVVFEYGKFCNKDQDGLWEFEFKNPEQTTDEVIGNIHENPDLLK